MPSLTSNTQTDTITPENDLLPVAPPVDLQVDLPVAQPVDLPVAQPAS